LKSLLEDDISKFTLVNGNSKHKTNTFYSKNRFLPKTTFLKDSGVVKIQALFHNVSIEKLLFCFVPTFMTKKMDPTTINILELNEFSPEELKKKYPKEEISDMPTYLHSYQSTFTFLDKRVGVGLYQMEYDEENKSFYQYNRPFIDERHEIDGKIDLFSKRKMKFTKENGEIFIDDAYFSYFFSIYNVKEIDKNTLLMNYVFSKL
jgi:hypothetical protein